MDNEKLEIEKKVNEGINLFENNKYEESIKFFEKLKENSKTSIIGIFFLGIIEIKRKNLKAAKKFFFDVLKINKDHEDANLNLGLVYLEEKEFDDFDSYDTKEFAKILRKISKPTLIVANKIDIPGADKNFNRLRERYNEVITVPASADSELTLRRAEQQELIKYAPGSEQFEIIHNEKLNEKQRNALDFIKQDIMGEYMRTGVQFAINVTVFKLLKMNAVYPVANEDTLADKKGRVLPDLVLLKDGATVKDLANEIHTGLSKGLLYAKDLRYNLRLPTHYQLRDRDVVSLVSATKKSSG